MKSSEKGKKRDKLLSKPWKAKKLFKVGLHRSSLNKELNKDQNAGDFPRRFG